jgi:hypothetical protein
MPGISSVCDSVMRLRGRSVRPPHGRCCSANGVRVEHGGINLPGGTRHHLGGLKEAPPDEPANPPWTNTEPMPLGEREHRLRGGLVVVHEVEPFAQRQDTRGRPRVAGTRAQAQPVEAGGDLVIRPGAGHAPHDAFGIRAGPVAMLARLRSGPSSRPTARPFPRLSLWPSSAPLAFPRVSSRGALTVRPERHVATSIATLYQLLARALLRTAPCRGCGHEPRARR